MAYSNSSLNTFANCMAKYEHCYIKHTPPCNPPSAHLRFGAMAHEVLYKAGKLKDEIKDGVVDKDAYYSVIPSELLYDDLKAEFSINSWNTYFNYVIKQVFEYENDILSEHNDAIVEREIKLQLTSDQLKQLGYYNISEPLVGVIDLLFYGKDWAVIIDYKFSTSRKGQDEFDLNSQLPLYALLVHINYDIPLHNIKIGYIDIPKKTFSKPIVLSNGTLSRAKTQNISQELYEMSVKTIHGEDAYYNCEPGGYYYDAWCNYAFNKAAYLSIQYLDMDVYKGTISDVLDAAVMIEHMKTNKLKFIKKYDSYSCKGCDYLDSCKPWTVVGEKQ